MALFTVVEFFFGVTPHCITAPSQSICVTYVSYATEICFVGEYGRGAKGCKDCSGQLFARFNGSLTNMCDRRICRFVHPPSSLAPIYFYGTVMFSDGLNFQKDLKSFGFLFLLFCHFYSIILVAQMSMLKFEFFSFLHFLPPSCISMKESFCIMRRSDSFLWINCLPIRD